MITTPVYKPVIPGWLPSFPSHWKVMRIKNLFREIDDRSVSGSEELLSVSQYTGITPKRESLENEDDNLTNAASLEGYKKVTAGDLVINIMLAWNGSLGISPYNGIVSPAYCVYRCLPGNNPEYFGYLFSTNLFKAEFRRNSTGIMDSRLRLYSDKFFGIFSITPPLEEQNKIVNFIAEQDQKINLFIEKKQRFITFLKEQRQSIITQTVTKGINQKAVLKLTGIEGLNKIPVHWVVRRLKNISSTISKGTTPSTIGSETTLEGVIRFLRAENLYENKISISPTFYIDQKTDEILFRSRLNEDDVLLVIAGATIGRTGIVTKEILPANTNQAVCFIRPKNVFPEFLLLWMQTSYITSQIWLNATQAAQPNLAMGKISTFYILYPPLEEQKQIVNYIKTETNIIDTAILKAEKEIELIKEYKEAMIAEAVMGKIIK